MWTHFICVLPALYLFLLVMMRTYPCLSLCIVVSAVQENDHFARDRGEAYYDATKLPHGNSAALMLLDPRNLYYLYKVRVHGSGTPSISPNICLLCVRFRMSFPRT